MIFFLNSDVKINFYTETIVYIFLYNRYNKLIELLYLLVLNDTALKIVKS